MCCNLEQTATIPNLESKCCEDRLQIHAKGPPRICIERNWLLLRVLETTTALHSEHVTWTVCRSPIVKMKAMISVALIAVLPTTTGFIGTTYRLQKSTLSMCDYQTQVLAAQPTIEEWLDVADPGLKKATLAMFRSVKEIAYKIRTASCDKMSCFNDFGKG